MWAAMSRASLTTLGVVLLVGSLSGCATAPAVGRGGQVYEVRVATVDGNPTSNRGSVSHPACVIQVAERVASVWLALASSGDHESPVVFEADAVALKDGILVERSWNEAVVHHVTDAELAVGTAVVYVPSTRHPTTVELRFDPVGRVSPASPVAPGSPVSPISRLGGSDHQHDLAKGRPGLEQPMSGSDLP
jgi:hypothetical protein